MESVPQPYVSVIIPIFSTPTKYFKECLDSLYNQTLQDAEFILVFDGENKDLFSICNTYKEKDDRFKIFIQPHLGVSVTRNFGIKQAKGEYITFVDADDSLFSNKTLNHCFSITEKTNSDIFLFNWTSKDQVDNSIWPQNKDYLSQVEKNYCLQQTINIRNPKFTGAPWAKLFSRNFIINNNIYYNEECVLGQDRVFNYKAFSLASKISYNNEIIYKYTTNRESATQQYRDNHLAITLNYIEQLYELAKDQYPFLIGREALSMFYISWNKCYMNTQNKQSFFSRMSNLSKVVKSARFQKLIKYIDTNDLSLAAQIEAFLLQHKIIFWIYLHGLKRMLLHG